MKPTEIILHCSATKEGKDFTVADIDRWHKARGFRKVGYQYIIYRDGSIHTGREDNEAGAHCIGHNAKAIGICYIGGVDKDGRPKDTRTPQQRESMIMLVKDLMAKYNIPLSNIFGHYQFQNKACPSFKIEKFKEELK